MELLHGFQLPAKPLFRPFVVGAGGANRDPEGRRRFLNRQVLIKDQMQDLLLAPWKTGERVTEQGLPFRFVDRLFD